MSKMPLLRPSMLTFVLSAGWHASVLHAARLSRFCFAREPIDAASRTLGRASGVHSGFKALVHSSGRAAASRHLISEISQ